MTADSLVCSTVGDALGGARSGDRSDPCLRSVEGEKNHATSNPRHCRAATELHDPIGETAGSLSSFRSEECLDFLP
jgi:hypothetical protein